MKEADHAPASSTPESKKTKKKSAKKKSTASGSKLSRTEKAVLTKFQECTKLFDDYRVAEEAIRAAQAAFATARDALRSISGLQAQVLADADPQAARVLAAEGILGGNRAGQNQGDEIIVREQRAEDLRAAPAADPAARTGGTGGSSASLEEDLAEFAEPVSAKDFADLAAPGPTGGSGGAAPQARYGADPFGTEDDEFSEHDRWPD